MKRRVAVTGLGLVGKDVIQHAVDMLVDGQAHQLAHEGRRGQHRFGEQGEETVHAAHPSPEWNPLHLVEVKCAEDLLE